MRLLLSFIIVFVVAITTISLVIFYTQIKTKIKQFCYKVKSLYGLSKKYYYHIKLIINSIDNKKISNSILTEIIFNQFCLFYEINYSDMDPNWELPSSDFKDNTAELTNLYRWIKKTRVDNYKELNNLDFNFDNNTFEYWGKPFEGLNYKIVDGELKITPITYIENKTKSNVFMTKTMKIRNDLFNLDTEKCSWILNKRNFFGI